MTRLLSWLADDTRDYLTADQCVAITCAFAVLFVILFGVAQ